jgi:hypothetical protein
MSLQSITINDFQSGLTKDKESFILMNDGFPVMENMYNWRGRLKRRDGFDKLGTSGRLRRELSAAVTGTIDMSSTPTATYNIITALGVAATEANASIELGSLTNIQVTIQGSVADATLDITTATQNFTITAAGTPTVTGATLNYSTGEIIVTHSVNDLAAANVTLTLAYYPTLPVMGIFQQELSAINAEQTVAFDTKYAYKYNGSTNDWEEWISGTTWSGTNANFFMDMNYSKSAANLNLFWVTNFSGKSGDLIRYTDGASWTDFHPIINGTNELHQCRFMVPFKSRVLAFNTFEETAALATSTHYPQRLRYSQNGNATDQASGWLDDTAGRGGFIDCPTNEHILSFAFIRDQLFIGMERSIWAVRYTGNEILPFIWEKVNSEFGWESMRSPVLFDKGAIGVGKKAVSVCDGVNVFRIDEEIPDEIFNIHNDNDGVERVAGIRDFTSELVYWTFPCSVTNGTFPDRMLVYNYRNKNWAIFKDSYTCFGEWQRFSDVTWSEIDESWETYNHTWNDGFNQSQYPNVIGGNQQGYIHILNTTVGNDSSLSITSLADSPTTITAVNHNLENGDIIKLSGIIGTASSMNELIGTVSNVAADTFEVDIALAAGFTYFGGGEIERFSNFSLKSKKFSALKQGQSISLSYIDFQCNATASGEFSCDILSDYSDVPINNGLDTFFNTIVETVPNDFEIPGSKKAYHRFFCNNHARFSQFELKLSDAQMLVESINKSEVLIDSLTLWVQLGGRITS